MQRHAVKAHGHIPKDHRGSGEPPMAGDSLGNHAAVLQKVPQAAGGPSRAVAHAGRVSEPLAKHWNHNLGTVKNLGSNFQV